MARFRWQAVSRLAVLGACRTGESPIRPDSGGSSRCTGDHKDRPDAFMVFSWTFCIGLFVLVAGAAAAAQEVGTVATVEGSAEVRRADTWSPATAGTAVHVGDVIRTGQPGRVRVVFQDDSVLNVGDNSQLGIDEQVFDPSAGAPRSLMRLLQGKVRALVSEYYQQTGAAYEIETATAVSGVRGTEFVVTYSPELALTEVVGISGRIAVHSVLDRATRGVYITAGELAAVRKGRFPTKPPRLDEDTFRQYLEGLEFIGGGRPESLTVDHPLLGGVSVPEPDRAPVPSVAQEVGGVPGTERDAASLLNQPPAVIEAVTGDLGVRF